MKNLAQQINLSTEKPQNVKQLLMFKVGNFLEMSMHNKLELFFSRLTIDLASIEDGDLNECVSRFTEFYNNKKQQANRENINYIACYLWIDEE